MKLFLVGYMGCGKSSLGRRIARRTNVRFIDTDSVIEEREGAETVDIFRYAGEEYFRCAERALIERIAAEKEDAVVSTGGGLPVWKDNMELMNAVGTTVYIRRSAEQIASRLTPYGRRKRPRLRGLDDGELVEFMKRNMAEREPFYAKANYVFDMEHMGDEQLVSAVIEIMNGDER
ncbi:MAG: shikimate kinase [Alistipes sp.]|nr:shikimate kinase [Alistipes sp.]